METIIKYSNSIHGPTGLYEFFTSLEADPNNYDIDCEGAYYNILPNNKIRLEPSGSLDYNQPSYNPDLREAEIVSYNDLNVGDLVTFLGPKHTHKYTASNDFIGKIVDKSGGHIMIDILDGSMYAKGDEIGDKERISGYTTGIMYKDSLYNMVRLVYNTPANNIVIGTVSAPSSFRLEYGNTSIMDGNIEYNDTTLTKKYLDQESYIKSKKAIPMTEIKRKNKPSKSKRRSRD